jgi:CRISPR/Cas system CSM-associated protein Csm2 small subunit
MIKENFLINLFCGHFYDAIRYGSMREKKKRDKHFVASLNAAGKNLSVNVYSNSKANFNLQLRVGVDHTQMRPFLSLLSNDRDTKIKTH